MWFFRIIYFVLVLFLYLFLSKVHDINTQVALIFAIAAFILGYLFEVIIRYLKKEKIVSALVFAFFFLLIANLLSVSFRPIFKDIFVILFINVIFVYIGLIFGYKNSDWLKDFFTSKSKKDGYFTPLKLLDSSTIIDGRVIDIVNTGFLEGKLVIPNFILKELQNISDSHDHLKRQKGRRGLDIVKELQSQEHLPVEITDIDFKNVKAVDEKLVELAKRLNAAIITTDYNLLKVAEIQNIIVLNINALAKAVKQTLLPGEVINISVVREGKERDQGVGYLDDGSMVVIENGRKYIGKTINIEVTSLLQSDSGRIVFGKPK